MRRAQFNDFIKVASNQEVYESAKELLVFELAGERFVSWKLDILESECTKRNKKIFTDASSDALFSLNSREFYMEKSDIINIKRIDHLTETELIRVLTNSLGAARKSPFVQEKEELITHFSEIFGLKSNELFIANVSGNSMIDAGIADGDRVVVQKRDNANSGDIIVANVDGNLFIKRIKYEGHDVWLISENKSYSPYRVSEGIMFSVFGKVTNIIKKVS
ncbi:MAG: S24 family peptidase [Candidatus Kapabacteria bacterium]|nr:S24 family peptidase [Candidatus Kapabacteria bacterium]